MEAIGQKQILLVDDDQVLGQVLKRVLETEGYQVTLAATGEEALTLLDQINIDLVMTDVYMPGISGIDLLTNIKETFPELPVIIVTGKPRVDAAVICMKKGADDYITKPLDPPYLKKVVADVFAKNPLHVRQDIDANEITSYGGDPFLGYKLIRKLSESNKGIVYLAKKSTGDTNFRYAIKLLKITRFSREQRPDLIERFVREAERTKHVSHPKIIKVVDYSITEGESIPYMVMEYFNGRTLGHAEVTSGNLNYRQKAQIIRQTAEAIMTIHASGIVHRNITSSNIMINDELQVKVTDFGIAHWPESDLTLPTDFLGTPQYMAPEAFQNAEVSQRSDIFSLGVVAYELFLGVLPFAPDGFTVLAQNIQNELPVEPRKIAPDFPIELQHILARLLKKIPDDRYGSVEDLLSDLDDFLASGKVTENPDRTSMMQSGKRNWK